MYTMCHPPAAREHSQLAGLPPLHHRDTGSRGGWKCCPQVFCTTSTPAHMGNQRGAAGRPGWVQACNLTPHGKRCPEMVGTGPCPAGQSTLWKIQDSCHRHGGLHLKRERMGMKPAQLQSSPCRGVWQGGWQGARGGRIKDGH